MLYQHLHCNGLVGKSSSVDDGVALFGIISVSVGLVGAGVAARTAASATAALAKVMILVSGK